MKKTILFSLVIFALIQTKAQVGINTTSPEAALDIVSNNSGVLLPRLTNTQIRDMPNAVEGMLAYNTSLECLMINQRAYNDDNGTDWRCLLVGSKGQLPENPFSKIKTDLNQTQSESTLNSIIVQ